LFSGGVFSLIRSALGWQQVDGARVEDVGDLKAIETKYGGKQVLRVAERLMPLVLKRWCQWDHPVTAAPNGKTVHAKCTFSICLYTTSSMFFTSFRQVRFTYVLHARRDFALSG
jgi:hypothetical protein